MKKGLIIGIVAAVVIAGVITVVILTNKSSKKRQAQINAMLAKLTPTQKQQYNSLVKIKTTTKEKKNTLEKILGIVKTGADIIQNTQSGGTTKITEHGVEGSW